jgi:hypothetical protein
LRLQRLCEQPIWSRDLPLEDTRALNNHIRHIATSSGLDLRKAQRFQKYSIEEQDRTIEGVRAVFPAMSRQDAQFHITKSITVFAGEMRRKQKCSTAVAGIPERD